MNIKLLYSEYKNKECLYLRTERISDIYNCTSDGVDEIIIDNDMFKSDCLSLAIIKLLKSISNKIISVVINDSFDNHLYFVNKLFDEKITVYENYSYIDQDRKSDEKKYKIYLEKEKVCLSNSVFLKLKIFFRNKKIKRKNKKIIQKAKEKYFLQRKIKPKKRKINLKNKLKKFNIPLLKK